MAVTAGQVASVAGSIGGRSNAIGGSLMTYSLKELGGKQPEINDTKTYNNGVKVVPSYLLKPVLVDKSNWHHILIDSGYYKESQIK